MDRIPKLYETEHIPTEDKVVELHFFMAGCDWYIVEYDGIDQFFGFVILNGDLGCAEWGYISFAELKELSYGFLEVDNDLHWKVRPAVAVDNIRKAMRWSPEETAN